MIVTVSAKRSRSEAIKAALARRKIGLAHVAAANTLFKMFGQEAWASAHYEVNNRRWEWRGYVYCVIINGRHEWFTRPDSMMNYVNRFISICQVAMANE